MKTAFLKFIGIFVVIAFVVSAYGCAGNGREEFWTSDDESETVFPETWEKQSSYEKSDISEMITEKAVEAANITDSQERTQTLVDLYNKCVDKSKLKRISMSQQTEKGTVNLGIEKIDLSKNEKLKNCTQTHDNAKFPCDLQRLSYDNVISAEKDNNKVVFTLKEYCGDTNITQGAAGYHSIVEKERTQEILDSAAGCLGLPGSVYVKEGKYNLIGGVVTAYFSEDFNTLEKVDFTGREDISGKVRYLLIEAEINISFRLASSYKA